MTASEWPAKCFLGLFFFFSPTECVARRCIQVDGILPQACTQAFAWPTSPLQLFLVTPESAATAQPVRCRSESDLQAGVIGVTRPLVRVPGLAPDPLHQNLQRSWGAAASGAMLPLYNAPEATPLCTDIRSLAVCLTSLVFLSVGYGITWSLGSRAKGN